MYEWNRLAIVVAVNFVSVFFIFQSAGSLYSVCFLLRAHVLWQVMQVGNEGKKEIRIVSIFEQSFVSSLMVKCSSNDCSLGDYLIKSLCLVTTTVDGERETQRHKKQSETLDSLFFFEHEHESERKKKLFLSQSVMLWKLWSVCNLLCKWNVSRRPASGYAQRYE